MSAAKPPPKLSAQHQRILRFLQGRDYTSPTRIAEELRCGHSSWASPKCLYLVKVGLLHRNARGAYRLASYGKPS